MNTRKQGRFEIGISGSTVRFGLMMLLAMGVAFAQDTPPQGEPGQEQGSDAAQEARDTQVAVTVGVATRSVSGNENVLRQYATPPKGLFLNLRWEPFTMSLQHAGGFEVRGLGQDDVVGGFDWYGFYGRSQVAICGSRTRFFDHTAANLRRSQRSLGEGYFKQTVLPGVVASLTYQRESLDQTFEAPHDAFNHTNRVWQAAVSANLGGGQAKVSFTDWRFADQTLRVPVTNSRTWVGSYTREWFPGFNLGAAFSRTTINQRGLPESEVKGWSVSGDWSISPSTLFLFRLSRENLSVPVVSRAYVQERIENSATLTHRWGAWNASVTYRRREQERVRGDRTFVDVPKWNLLEGRVQATLFPGVRFSARGYRERLINRPLMVTNDPRSLAWDDRWFGQAKVTVGTDTWSAYGVLSYRHNKNTPRFVNVKSRNLTLGAEWQATATLGFRAEAIWDSIEARSEVQTAPLLDAYFPGSRILSIGASWAFRPEWFLDIGYVESTVSNDNPLLLRDGNYRSRMFTGSLTYTGVKGYEFALTYAPWHYTDRLFNPMGYDSSIWSLTAKIKF